MLGKDAGQRPWSFVLDEPTKILFVDDDVILTEFAKVHLATPVATVEAEHDGAAALKRLLAEPFDIALVDIEMPGMSGLDLVARIRDEPTLRHLPVIMVTGREDVVSIDRSFERGATGFATKPVNWRQLSHQIRYVLRNSRAEQAVRDARDRAEQTSALKTGLLAAMRHEFRTPLAAIIGFSDLMRAQIAVGGVSAEFAEAVGFINDAGRRLLSTFTDMMQYAQLMAQDREPVIGEHRVGRLIEAARAELQAGRAGEPSDLAVSVDDPDLEIACDRELVVAALRHLMLNAVVHGRQDCALTAGRAADGSVMLTVSDRGPGISPDRLAACLNAFERSDMSMARDAQGLGLGLPIAQAVAKLHGGRLDIASSPEGGTRVALVFPARVVVSGSDVADVRAA